MPSTVEDLGKATKQAHPGQFDDKDDIEVGRAVKQAYPDQFGDVTDQAGFGQRLSENIPHPIDMLQSVVNSMATHQQAAQDEWKKGNHVKAAMHALAAANPSMAMGFDQAQSSLQHAQNVASMQQAAPPGSPISHEAIQEGLKAIPMVGENLANAQQDYTDKNYAGLAGAATGAGLTAAIPKVPDVLEGAKDTVKDLGSQVKTAIIKKLAEPGGRDTMFGVAQILGAPVADVAAQALGMGHWVGGALGISGARSLIKGQFGKWEAGAELPTSTELPKGQPTPFTRQNTVTSPGAEPQQVTSENVAGGGAPAATPPSTPETPQPPSAEAQQASAMGINDYDNAHPDVKKVVQSALANKARLEAIRQRQATTPAASIPETIRSMQPSAEVAPEPTTGKDNQGSQAFTSNNPPGGHEVLGLEPTPTQNPSSAVAGVAYHPESGEAALHMQNGKKLVYPGKTQTDVDEMIAHPSPGTLYNQKWRNAAKTDTSIMRPNTPGEAMRFNNLDPVKSIASNMLDANDLRGIVDAKISANGWNTTDHVTQIRQSVTEAADKMNQARSAAGKPPISTSAINSVIRGYQP